MKKILFTLMAIFATSFSANAMDFELARERALFLSDKMAYELNLTDDQYEAVYEVNLDYFLGIRSEADIDGVYWSNRNIDLGYILCDWQFRAYCDALYFYRPLYWSAAGWHFRIYARYPHRTFFYFSRPVCYVSYHGAHSWRHHGGSYYHGRSYGVAHRPGGDGRGMRDSYHGTHNHGGYNRDYQSHGNNRQGADRGRYDGGDNRRSDGNDRGGRGESTRRSNNNRQDGNSDGVYNSGSSNNRQYQERGSSTRRSYDNSGTRYNNGGSASSGASSRGSSSYGGGSSRGSSSHSSGSHGGGGGGGSQRGGGAGGHSGGRR